MKRFFCTLFIIAFSSLSVYAQVTNEKRIEFELKEGYEGFSLTEFKDKGIMVYYHEEKSKEGMTTWKADHYSTDLELIDSKEFKISENFHLSKSKEDGANMYLYFTSRTGAYQLIQINVESLNLRTIKGTIPNKSAELNIETLDEKVFIVYQSKKLLTLKKFDFLTGKEIAFNITIEGVKSTAISFKNFQIDETSAELYVFLNTYISKEMDVHVQRFSEEGQLLESINLTEGTDKNMTSVSGSYIDDGKYIYTGTYSSNKKAIGSVSEGIYICKTTNGKKDFLKFYNFTDFKEFLSYLPQKQQDKIEKKKSKVEAKGKEYAISYLMASHNVRFMDGKFIYIGEAFYPTYRTEMYTSYSNGQAVTKTKQVFDGYQYTHSTVAAFDPEGEKLWDVTFEMYPWHKPFKIMKFIKVTETNPTEIGMMFSSSSSIKSKAISTDGEVLSEKSLSFIETGNDEDKVKSTFSNLVFWYDNYFLAHGTQKIKNRDEKEERGKSKRAVYFINKIEYIF